jgi:hypothetical protein
LCIPHNATRNAFIDECLVAFLSIATRFGTQ